MRAAPVAAALLLSAAAQAQSGDIVVTGAGLAPPPGDATLATATIARARIAQSASGRLEDVLGDVAGIAQFRRSDSTSAHPTAQGITLRGLGGNASSRALLLLDGVPQTDPFGGWIAFPAYSTARLGAIRVVRGGGNGLAGPGALAGTIELESAAPGRIGPLDVSAWYGSRASLDASAVGAARLGGGFVTLAGEYARGDGFVPVVAEDRGAVDRAAPYEQASLAARAVVPLGAATELQANLAGFADHRDRGVDFTRVRSAGTDASVRLVGHGDWGWSALAWLQTRRFASGFASVNAARDSVSPALDQYNVPATGVGGRIEVQPPTDGPLALRFGADIRRVSGRTQELYSFASGLPTRRRVAGGDSLTAGSFADLSFARGPLTLDLGGRIDRWSIGDGRRRETPLAGGAAFTDARFPDRAGWQGTGRIGAAYQADPALKLRAAGYRGWRLPALNELYRPFRVGPDATAANPALDPERLWGAEAGLDWQVLPRATLSATGFWNRLEGAIANVTLAQGPGNFPGVGFVSAAGVYRQRRNLDAVESHGVEVDARWQAGNWAASASYAYADPRVAARGAAASLDGLRPAQTALHHASATLGWHRPDGLGGSLTARYASRRFEDDLNAEPLASAFTLDAELGLPLGAGLMLLARGENLGDARVEAGIGGDGVIERATPRTLWIGMRYRPR